ncbi:MAG: glycosyltransferase family 2 protein [Anaerolineaceae bacterium]|nr:glycosyltransferase family 2 protein [Anaerolineaceae bacterium]
MSIIKKRTQAPEANHYMTPGPGLLPLVSVIIPTYNRPEYLVQTVNSVLSQTYPNIEVIVVDDASTDDTPLVMSAYQDRIKYLRHTVNSAGEAVYNTGLSVARGEYIDFLDHDDLFYPSKIEKQVRLLEKRKDLGLVHCGYHHIDSKGNRTELVSFLPEGKLLEQLLNGDFIWSGAPLIRRACLDRHDLFGDPFWCTGDWSRLLRIAMAGYPFGCLQEPLGAYRILEDSEMSNVRGLEDWQIPTLDRVFSDPFLPPETLKKKTESYARLRLYLSGRYYAARAWDDAQRNLSSALDLNPSWIDEPTPLLLLISEDANGIRSRAPLEYIQGMFNHLPPNAEGLRSAYTRLLSLVHLGMALNEYKNRDRSSTIDSFTATFEVDDFLIKHPDIFVKILTKKAIMLPKDDPIQYTEGIFQLLPPKARSLHSMQKQTLGQIRVLSSFLDHFEGKYHSIPKKISRAILENPSLLTNRGVLSILSKSIVSLIRQ